MLNDTCAFLYPHLHKHLHVHKHTHCLTHARACMHARARACTHARTYIVCAYVGAQRVGTCPIWLFPWLGKRKGHACNALATCCIATSLVWLMRRPLECLAKVHGELEGVDTIIISILNAH